MITQALVPKRNWLSWGTLAVKWSLVFVEHNNDKISGGNTTALKLVLKILPLLDHLQSATVDGYRFQFYNL